MRQPASATRRREVSSASWHRVSLGPICEREGCGIKAGGGGVDTLLPRVRFNVAQAHNDGGGDPNHAMLTRKVFVDVTNWEDAEWQGEQTSQRRGGQSYFFSFALLRKITTECPRNPRNLGVISRFLLPFPRVLQRRSGRCQSRRPAHWGAL